jgi:hypothetical protein
MFSMNSLSHKRLHTLQGSPFLERLCTPPPFFPAVEIPDHLRKRTKAIGKRERLLIWWLTYRLAVDRRVDTATIEDAAREIRLTAQQIDTVRQEHPVHWERMLLKRELRLAHYRKHGSVPRGITPGWPLGRNVDQIGMKLHRKQRSVAKSPKKLVQWLAVCLANTSAF